MVAAQNEDDEDKWSDIMSDFSDDDNEIFKKLEMRKDHRQLGAQ